jgi:alkylhydroperoxidase family enzyme
MPRLNYVPVDIKEPVDLVASMRGLRGGGLNAADRMILNAPTFAGGFHELTRAARLLSLPEKLRTLAICCVAILNDATYQMDKHAPAFLKAGGTKEQLDALGQIDSAPISDRLFDDAERAVVRLTTEMTRQVKVSDSTFAAVGAVFDNHEQIVEIVGLIGMYNMVSRILVALEVEEE